MQTPTTSVRGLRSASAAVALAISVLTLSVPPSGAGLPSTTPAATVAADEAPVSSPRSAGEPARIVARDRVTARTLRLTIATDAFESPVPVEVTLPVGYRAHPQRRWPVTYYLHGANHDETTFRSYNGEAATASFPSIVVSPRGDAGFWSDWFNAGAQGPPKYETFVIDQLLPLIDSTFRTRADRAHRAVMGESMGGFGVMKLAAKHPEDFAAAASLSGGLDSNLAPGAAVITAAPTLQGRAPGSIFGDRVTQEIRWRGENPTDLAPNLRGLDLQLFTGNGVYDPSHGETPDEASAGCALEGGIIQPTSVSMHRRLNALGIDHRWVPLPWGCHGKALFEHEIRRAVVRLARVFARPTPPPATFDHRSVAPVFEAWDWRVRTDRRRAVEFMDLRHAGRGGVRLTGSGSTVVTTARLFRGQTRVRVTTGTTATTVRATRSGRITFTVRLGAPHTQQAYTLGAPTSATTAAVRFQPVRRAG